MPLRLSSVLQSIAVGAFLVAVQAAMPAVAGGAGCGATHQECYEKVVRPDTYATVERQVVVQPARSEVVREPAVVMNRLERVEVAPGRFHAQHIPAQYGSIERSVLVKPASVQYSVVPAQYRTVHETVVVRPASWRWERQVDRHGRETMCKVQIPAETRTVARQVMVAGAQRVAHTTAAVYHTVRQTVEVAPARVRHTHIPATYAYVDRAVVVRPATTRVVTHPPVLGVTHQKVLVNKGGAEWRRTSGHWR